MIPLQILTFLPPRGELASRVTTHTLGTGCIGPVRFAFGFLPGAHLARLVMRKCLLFCLLRQSKEKKKEKHRECSYLRVTSPGHGIMAAVGFCISWSDMPIQTWFPGW